MGDPLELGQFFRLDDGSLEAKIILAQGRQNTNYDIYLYACHPFFLQGYCTMTNGENTAFVPIMEFLTSRGFPGYMGYNSDSRGLRAHPALHAAAAGLSVDILQGRDNSAGREGDRQRARTRRRCG